MIGTKGGRMSWRDAFGAAVRGQGGLVELIRALEKACDDVTSARKHARQLGEQADQIERKIRCILRAFEEVQATAKKNGDVSAAEVDRIALRHLTKL